MVVLALILSPIPRHLSQTLLPCVCVMHCLKRHKRYGKKCHYLLINCLTVQLMSDGTFLISLNSLATLLTDSMASLSICRTASARTQPLLEGWYAQVAVEMLGAHGCPAVGPLTLREHAATIRNRLFFCVCVNIVSLLFVHKCVNTNWMHLVYTHFKQGSSVASCVHQCPPPPCHYSTQEGFPNGLETSLTLTGCRKPKTLSLDSNLGKSSIRLGRAPASTPCKCWQESQ